MRVCVKCEDLPKNLLALFLKHLISIPETFTFHGKDAVQPEKVLIIKSCVYSKLDQQFMETTYS